MKQKQPGSPVPLAVCEACSLIWGIFIAGGTVYLTEWRGWSAWTWLGAILLMTAWSCKYCRVPEPESKEQKGEKSDSAHVHWV